MFEFEVNHATLSINQVSSQVKKSFELARHDFAAITIHQWEEHCTECAMPQCYETCDLYLSRKDGKCRRFVEGISHIRGLNNDNDYLVKIAFKKWGSLMSTGYFDLVEYGKALQFDKKINNISALAATIPDSNISIFGRRGVSSRLTRRYKNKVLKKFLEKEKINIEPDYFLIEAYNPHDKNIDLTFMIRAIEGKKNKTPYQKRLILNQGFHSIKIDYQEIRSSIEYGQQHFISIIPNFANFPNEIMTVYFGIIGFIKHKNIIGINEKYVKVVAWDLDNTVWKGVLVEDGSDKLELMPGIEYTMRTLDSRGIMNSVVSKNNHNDAIRQLKKFGLDELIVFPQIGWNPKSQAIKSMINEFNVGEDTIVFIDDSPFERNEVKAANPLVRVYDSIEYNKILDYPSFNPEQSTESSRRREYYKSQNKRKNEENSFQGDYFDFIRTCEIQLIIFNADERNIERIQELVQRTNQLNFSGNRYTRKEISQLINNNDFDKFCMQCKDIYGDYGIVGFCIVNNKIPNVKDLMFSCRIQSKRIEHAFLSWILYVYRNKGFKKLFAEYKKTEKNAPAGRVFDDLGFIKNANYNNFEFSLDNIIPWENLISITYEGQSWKL